MVGITTFPFKWVGIKVRGGLVLVRVRASDEVHKGESFYGACRPSLLKTHTCFSLSTWNPQSPLGFLLNSNLRVKRSVILVVDLSLYWTVPVERWVTVRSLLLGSEDRGKRGRLESVSVVLFLIFRVVGKRKRKISLVKGLGLYPYWFFRMSVGSV